MTFATKQADHRRQQQRILPLLLLTVTLLLAAHFVMAWQERAALIERSLEAQQSVINATADRLQTTMQKASLLATLLADDLVERRSRVASPGYRDRLLRLVRENPDIDMVALLDKDGNAVVCALPPPTPALNFRDREYFQHHQTHAGGGIRIGYPVFSRATQRQVIPVTRRISDAEGRFIGVVVITLDSAAMVTEFKELKLGPRAFIAIDHVDGQVLTRQPPDPRGPNMSMRGTPQYENYLSKQMAGAFEGISPLDGLARRYAFKRLADFPLIMVSGISDDDVLEAWLQSAVVKLGYLMALSIALAFVSLTLYRKLGQLQKADLKSQRSLHQLQAYRAALDDYVIGVVLDTDGIVLEANDRFCLVSGFSREELVGRCFPVLDGRVEDIEFRKTLRLCLQTGAVWRGVRLACSKFGDRFWLSSCLLPLPEIEGESRQFLLAQIDITSQKTVEERMAKANEELGNTLRLKKAILDSAPSAIIASDANGRIVLFNEAAEQLLGYRDSDAKSGLSPIIFHDPGEVTQALQISRPSTGLAGIAYTDLVPVLASDSAREWTYHGRDGAPIPVRLRVSPLRRADGSLDGHVTVVTDLTQQKRLRRLKSDFVSVVSHELRTPLTAIKGALSLVNASLAGSATSQQGKLLGMATDNCERLVRLVSDILDLDKLSQGKMSLRRQVQPLQPLLDKAIDLNQPYAATHQVSLRAIGLPQSVHVDIDEDRMLQVMANLLSNASKFSPAGSEVRIRASADGDDIVIAIEDDGAGMSAEFHAHVFEPFTQSDTAGTRRKGGTGLGLSIAKGYVEAHGGSLSFESVELVGTTFFIRLPCVAVESA